MHEISDVSLQAGGVVELTDLHVISLLPEIEGVALRLRPARLTTPDDSSGRQVLDVVVEQTLGRATPVSIRWQAVDAARDAHLTGDEFEVITAGISPLTVKRFGHSDTFLI